MDSSKQQETQVPDEVAIMDPWANSVINPQDLLASFPTFETKAGGAVSDMNIYRSRTPTATPESSKCGSSEPNSDISEGFDVGPDINVESFGDSWMPFDPSETNGLFEMNSLNVNSGEDLKTFDGDQPVVKDQSWGAVFDISAWERFSSTDSFYSMEAEGVLTAAKPPCSPGSTYLLSALALQQQQSINASWSLPRSRELPPPPDASKVKLSPGFLTDLEKKPTHDVREAKACWECHISMTMCSPCSLGNTSEQSARPFNTKLPGQVKNMADSGTEVDTLMRHIQEKDKNSESQPPPTQHALEASCTPQYRTQAIIKESNPSLAAPQPHGGLDDGHRLPKLSGPMMSNRTSPVSAHPHSSNTAPQGYQSRLSYNGYKLPAMTGPIMSKVHSPENQAALVGSMSIQYPPQMDEPIFAYHPSHKPLDDKVFKCDQCPQSFNRYPDLKRHKTIHLVVKPYPCGHCEKSFSRKESLKRHILVKGCGKSPEDTSKKVLEDPETAARLNMSLKSDFYPTILGTKCPGPEELQLCQVDSSNAGHLFEGQLEGDPSPCDQLRISSDVEPIISTFYHEGSPKLTESQPHNSCIPLLPSINDNSEVEPPSKLQGESSSSRNNTLSSNTDDDTDWGEDDFTGSLQDLHFPGFSAFSKEGLISQEQMKNSLVRPVFSPMKQEMIDRIMKEFWAIFEQESGSVQNRSPVTVSEESETDNTDTPCEGGAGSSQNIGSESSTGILKTSQKSTLSTLAGRKREAQDDEDQNNREERSPKRPRKFLSPPQNQDDNTKFACPYRKRDPRKYCIQHWRSCALTPLETVARVKGHLYRHHRIFPCQRCKNLFKDQDAVNLHLKEPKGCQLRDVEQADGVTAEIVEKLRSKRKVQRDQTEANRWKDIYKLLFPNEMIPNPYFEAVQEDVILSPDEGGLADYEEYCRRELPRDFRAALEEIVHNESQPIEEGIRNQLLNIIRDCQDRVFSRYRSSATAAGTPSKITDNSHSPMLASQETMLNISIGADAASEVSFGTLPLPFFQPPPPQTHLESRLEVSDLPNNVSKAPEGSDQSDSGYGSNSLGLNSRLSSVFQNFSDSASLTNSQSHAALEPVLDHTQTARETENGLVHNGNYSPDSREIAASVFDDSWYHNSELAERSDWYPYMNIE